MRMKVNPAAASCFISSPCGSVKWILMPRPKGSVVGEAGSAIDIGGFAGGPGFATRTVVARVVVVVVVVAAVVLLVVVVVVVAVAAKQAEQAVRQTIGMNRGIMGADCNRASRYFPAAAPPPPSRSAADATVARVASCGDGSIFSSLRISATYSLMRLSLSN